MRDFIGTGLSDAVTTRNVVNIIRVLVEDENCVAFVPYNYVAEKEGKKGDPKVHFAPKDSGRPVQIVDIQSNQERFNFSVRCLVDVKVECETDNGIELKDMKVWRTYTIIRDGSLVMDKISAKLSESAYNDLVAVPSLLFLNDTEVTEKFAYDKDTVYSISLSDIPLVSPNWARPNVLAFHKMLLDSSRLAEQAKQYKKLLKESNQPLSTDSTPDVYKEEIVDYGHSAGKTVNCVTYTVKELPGYKTPKYESATTQEYSSIVKTLADYRFRCACIKWAMEEAISRRRSPYNWSELYQKKTGSNTYYQECLVDINGTNYLLERCEFSKLV